MYKPYCDNCGKEMLGTASGWAYIKAGERGVKVTIVPSWDVDKATHAEQPIICNECAMKALIEKYPQVSA